MHRSRHGYTFAELLIVLVIVGGLMFFALPKFSGLMERKQLSAAREEIAAAIATARAAAVQKGRTATVYISGNSIRVTAVTNGSGGTTTIVPQKSLLASYNVGVVSTDTAITFDMRGFASPRLASTGIVRITGSSRRDSVCITTAGQLMPRSCSL